MTDTWDDDDRAIARALGVDAPPGAEADADAISEYETVLGALPFEPVAPLAPGRGGTAPPLTIEEIARATPDEISSRYLGTKSAAVSFGVVLSVDEPNFTVTSHGPTSTDARPWKSGPSTSTLAPIETENVMSPNQVSIVIPADTRT